MESPKAIQDLEAMIRGSRNDAATHLIRKLGFERIAAELTSPTVELYDEEHGGGLWVGRAYSKYSRRLPDPVEQVTHGANAYQVCRFYYLLAYGRLISPERSRQMLGFLSNTGMHHKLLITCIERRICRGSIANRGRGRSGTQIPYSYGKRAIANTFS